MVNWVFNSNRTGKKCKDHLGQEFPSIRAMCDHWHVSRSCYDVRRKIGMSLEEALTVPVRTDKQHGVLDGNWD